jgi:hypothetical protein
MDKDWEYKWAQERQREFHRAVVDMMAMQDVLKAIKTGRIFEGNLLHTPACTGINRMLVLSGLKSVFICVVRCKA